MDVLPKHEKKPTQKRDIEGLAVGGPQSIIMAVLCVIFSILPEDKPYYFMDVGAPDDILESVSLGVNVDMFNCAIRMRTMGRYGLVLRALVGLIYATHIMQRTNTHLIRSHFILLNTMTVVRTCII